MRFDAVCDLVERLLQLDEVVNNKYGARPHQYITAKLGITDKELYLLRMRRNEDNKFKFRGGMNNVIFNIHKEFKHLGLPSYFHEHKRFFVRSSEKELSYRAVMDRQNDTPFMSTVNTKPRRTIICATTEDMADKILALTLACGLPKTAYKEMCLNILNEASELSQIIGSNPALMMHQRLGRETRRAPFVEADDPNQMSKSFGKQKDHLLSIMNGTPYAYQSDIALRLTIWWIAMELDGTLPAARFGNVLKCRNKATKYLSTISPETIRSILMERKARSKADIPGIKEIRQSISKFGYTIERNKDGGGYVLQGNGFKLSGLTGREAYISSAVIKQERKLVHISQTVAEAAIRSANQAAQEAQSTAKDEASAGITEADV